MTTSSIPACFALSEPLILNDVWAVDKPHLSNRRKKKKQLPAFAL